MELQGRAAGRCSSEAAWEGSELTRDHNQGPMGKREPEGGALCRKGPLKKKRTDRSYVSANRKKRGKQMITHTTRCTVGWGEKGERGNG